MPISESKPPLTATLLLTTRRPGECRDNQMLRNSIRVETTAAPASAGADHPPDYPTTPQTIATTNRNAAVKITPWSTA